MHPVQLHRCLPVARRRKQAYARLIGAGFASSFRTVVRTWTLPTNAALDIYGFECLIDRQGISGGKDWKRRLGSLISEADTVVFVLSPASTHPEICLGATCEAHPSSSIPAPWDCRPTSAPAGGASAQGCARAHGPASRLHPRE